MTSTIAGTAGTRTTTKQKVGLVLCLLYSLGNIPSVLTAPPDGETGPPMAILVVDTLLGVVGLVAAVLAWRGNGTALRIAAGAIILITVTAVPAFFVDVPMWVKGLSAVSVVWTVAAVVLMFSRDPRPAAVVD